MGHRWLSKASWTKQLYMIHRHCKNLLIQFVDIATSQAGGLCLKPGEFELRASQRTQHSKAGARQSKGGWNTSALVWLGWIAWIKLSCLGGSDNTLRCFKAVRHGLCIPGCTIPPPMSCFVILAELWARGRRSHNVQQTAQPIRIYQPCLCVVPVKIPESLAFVCVEHLRRCKTSNLHLTRFRLRF